MDIWPATATFAFVRGNFSLAEINLYRTFNGIVERERPLMIFVADNTVVDY